MFTKRHKRELESELEKLKSELNKTRHNLADAYSREDLLRNRYNQVRSELTCALDFQISLVKSYSEQNRELQKKVCELENQLLQQILLNTKLMTKQPKYGRPKI